MPETLTRMYQGRVVRAEAAPPAAKRRKGGAQPPQPPTPDPIPLDELEAHHALFQDAVNYYLVAFAALAAPEGDAAMTKLRRRLAECWLPFPRGTRHFRGLRASLEPYLPPGSCEGDIEPAFPAILAANPVSPAVLANAVGAVAERLAGGGGVQQGGRSFLPLFCDPTSNARSPVDAEKRQRDTARKWLPHYLHDPATTPEGAAARLQLHWFANLNRQTPKGGETPAERLAAAIGASRDPAGLAGAERTAGLDRLEKMLDGKLPAIPAIVGSSAKGKEQLRLRAFLLFKYLEASEFTFDLLRERFPAPKPGVKRPPAPHEPAPGEKDSIQLARGERGFVFPAFTSLPAWGGDGRSTGWKEFDIAAFKEALKVINQYQTKTAEREKKAEEIRGQIARMETGVKPPKRKARDEEGEGGEEDLPVLGGDPRWDLLKRLLLDLADDPREGYGLTRRSLRGFSELREKWRGRVKAGQEPSPEVSEKLLQDAAKFQSENSDRIGDINLFRALAEPRYWSLWQEPTDDEDAKSQRRHFAPDILAAHCKYLELQEDARRKAEPISFTPADAIASPRQFLFSDLNPKPLHLPAAGDGPFAVEVSLARRDGAGHWREARARLYYSAPRLRRDGLRRTGETSLNGAQWLPPMVAALGLPEPAAQDLTKAPVGLMQKAERRDGARRMLLNFPLSLDPAKLQAQVGKQAWAGQMAAYGKDKDKKIFYLRWPDKAKSESNPDPWWRRVEPFTCLAVDLGQRDAGAFALLRARPESAEANAQERRVGQDGEKSWFASLAACGLMRLPGEDAQVLRDGKWAQEYSGEKGRCATSEETADAEAICRRLDLDPGEWDLSRPEKGQAGPDAPKDAIPKPSFPQQNSHLLRAANRALYWQRQCHRWLWLLREAEEQRRARALKEISEIEPKGPRASWPEWARNGNVAELDAAIAREITRLSEALPAELALIANRILPLREKRWVWRPHSDASVRQDGWHELATIAAPGHRPLLAGQRGLSMERIEQIEILRRRLQTLNRLLRRPPGSPPPTREEMRDHTVPDPCQEILEKLDRIKRQRVNQIAHMILAQALGVEPKPHAMDPAERRARDQHAEYQRISGRQPADFIVLEDLSRYLTSQDRPRRENSRLMQWCHRQLLAKVKEVAEPFGICVLETAPAYSSKLCSRTGAAGFRAVELTPASALGFPWRQLLGDPKEKHHAEAAGLFTWLRIANAGRAAANKKPRCLIAPDRGGPLFVSLKDQRVVQADINAAINLGLRAIAAPDAAEIHLRIPTVVKNGRIFARAKYGREIARWGKPTAGETGPEIHPAKGADFSALLKDSRQPNFFADVASLAHFDRAAIAGLDVPLASGRGLWRSVRDVEWKACQEINRRRMDKWGFGEAIAKAAAASAAGGGD